MIFLKKTFYNYKNWYNDIKDSINISKVAIIIVGNKPNLPNIEVNMGKNEKFSEQYNLQLIETSCKDNINMIKLDTDYKQQLKKRRSKVDESSFIDNGGNKKNVAIRRNKNIKHF